MSTARSIRMARKAAHAYDPPDDDRPDDARRVVALVIASWAAVAATLYVITGGLSI